MNDQVYNSDSSKKDLDIGMTTYKTNTFSYLKNTFDVCEIHSKSIVLLNNKGFLLPLCEMHQDDDDILRMLSEWRNNYKTVFPTQFESSIESTKTWLKNNGRLYG